MNAVSPGPVETPILVVAFLASPESGWVNGHNIIADGGVSGPVLTGITPAPELI